MRAFSASDRLLGQRLEALYRLYGPETAGTDPILFPRRYPSPEDREVAGWIASAFAYGQVQTIQASVGRILAALGPRPARALDAIADFPAFSRDALPGFRHRFHGARDAAALLFVIARARQEAGSRAGLLRARVRRGGSRRGKPRLPRRRADRGVRLSPGPRHTAHPRALARPILLSGPRRRVRLQALEPLPALDGPQRRAGFRPVAGNSDRSPGRSDRHARPPHRPPPPA